MIYVEIKNNNVNNNDNSNSQSSVIDSNNQNMLNNIFSGTETDDDKKLEVDNVICDSIYFVSGEVKNDLSFGKILTVVNSDMTISGDNNLNIFSKGKSMSLYNTDLYIYDDNENLNVYIDSNGNAVYKGELDIFENVTFRKDLILVDDSGNTFIVDALGDMRLYNGSLTIGGKNIFYVSNNGEVTIGSDTIILGGTLTVNNSDTFNVTNLGLTTIKSDTLITSGSLTVNNSDTFNVTNLGLMTIKSDTLITSGSLTVNNNIIGSGSITSYGNITSTNGSMTSYGDITSTNGSLYINDGSMSIKHDLRITSGNFKLQMQTNIITSTSYGEPGTIICKTDGLYICIGNYSWKKISYENI